MRMLSLLLFTVLLIPRHPGSLAGTVKDAEGQPVPWVQVTVDEECGTLTGPAGQFTLNSLEHGDHVLRATTSGFTTLLDTVSVRAGDTVRVALVLQSSLTRQQRDSARSGIVAVMSMQSSSEPSWVKSCH